MILIEHRLGLVLGNLKSNWKSSFLAQSVGTFLEVFLQPALLVFDSFEGKPDKIADFERNSLGL